MIESTIDIKHKGNGEIQRYQIVKGFSFDDIDFAYPRFSREVFDEMCLIYDLYITPKHRDEYSFLVLFNVPENINLPFQSSKLFDRNLILLDQLYNEYSQGLIAVCNGSVSFSDMEMKYLVDRLKAIGFLKIFQGKGESIKFIPVDSSFGFLSQEPRAKVIANSHFFEMELLDIDSNYDMLGTPFGLALRNGQIFLPPLNDREALVVDYDGRVSIIKPKLEELEIEIDGMIYKHGNNATVYARPGTRITPKAKCVDFVIVGRRIAAINIGGNTAIPMAGFVLSVDEDVKAIASIINSLNRNTAINQFEVTYHGMEEYKLGIQVGSSLVIKGDKCKDFNSPFYDKARSNIPFPPCVYPLDYNEGKSSRMALGSDNDNNPMLVWAEGANKRGYRKGIDSTGVSLIEFADYCASIGLEYALNLDGGGSAEILVDGKREMRVTADDRERPVPIAIVVNEL